MKIQCDMCEKEEASVFCTSDEASLCGNCDRNVHHANKLAKKHLRFSLLHPSSSKEAPLCDLCQDKRAFVFCQQDRAILCRECDIPIHKANEHTEKHNRFLLTGVKLSSSSALYPTSSASSSSSVSDGRKVSTDSMSKPEFVLPQRVDSTSNERKVSAPNYNYQKVRDNEISDGSDSVSTSSLSEYLMETLPGWCVEDFLDASFPPHGSCKIFDPLLPLMDQGLQRNLAFLKSEDSAIWVPQAPQQSSQVPLYFPPQNNVFTGIEGGNRKIGREFKENGLTSTQTNPLPLQLKKSRHFW